MLTFYLHDQRPFTGPSENKTEILLKRTLNDFDQFQWFIELVPSGKLTAYSLAEKWNVCFLINGSNHSDGISFIYGVQLPEYICTSCIRRKTTVRFLMAQENKCNIFGSDFSCLYHAHNVFGASHTIYTITKELDPCIMRPKRKLTSQLQVVLRFRTSCVPVAWCFISELGYIYVS
jgi:hypothetical protein